MVLGVLSLMVLMAVSFAISMRTERVAAGNQLDTVRARQLARVGLVRAMDQLYRECGRDLPDSNLVYQEWAVTNSYAVNPTNTPPVDFLKGSASNFVPRSLWDAAVAVSDTNASANSNYWISIISEVKDPNDSDHGTTNLIGRVAFMILNCSGLLDANFVGGADRGIGANPVEIALTNLPEMFGAAGVTFLNDRADLVRFETLEELNELNDYASTNLSVYSRAPAGYYTNDATTLVGTQVNLGGELADILARRELIVGTLTNADFDPNQAGLLFTNLLHYLDKDAENGPQDYGVGGGEFSNAFVAPVPMVNELVFENTVTCEKLDDTAVGVHRYKIDTALWVELWNPFVASAPHVPTIHLSGQSYGGIAQVSPANFPCDPVYPGQFLVRKCDFGTATFQSGSGPIDVGVSNLSVEVRRAAINLMDLVFPYRDLRVTIDLPATEGAQAAELFVMECVDPRFNWDPNDLTQWQVQGNQPSTGKINLATTTFWADPINQGCDKSPEMYVACSNQLHSVGELGCLVYSNWSTIKLYGPGAHPVMDYFAIETNCDEFVTNVVWRGRVNPNTTNREVLAAVFATMPVDEHPWQNAADRLDWNQAGEVADFIIEHGPYTNLSDVCRLDWGNAAFIGIATNELQREAFIRNTSGLLSTRGQVYTILIEAQVASGGNIPRNPSRQRAVAVVWRDAWTGEMIVRYLKWLPD